jgi:alpha-ketoglutarate-dependent taurine dioxygenase
MSVSGSTLQLATRPLMPAFGVEILDVDVASAGRETLAEIATWLFRHGAILLRGQALDQAAQVAFTNVFGVPAGNDYPEWCDPDYPEIYVISNKVVNGRRIGDPAAGLNWHTDMNFHRNPALCTMLHALEVPREGSDTLLADVCAAWNAIPADRQRQLDGLKVQHSFSKLMAKRGRAVSKEQLEALPDVIHPLVRRHAHDGRKSLWVSSSLVIRGIIGMPEAEAIDLIDELIAFATQDQFVYRHKWRRGDVLVWDNRCTLHRGTPFDMENDVRHVHRTWVRGEAPQ